MGEVEDKTETVVEPTEVIEPAPKDRLIDGAKVYIARRR